MKKGICYLVGGFGLLAIILLWKASKQAATAKQKTQDELDAATKPF
jgi:hypothetical protein